eukprot:PhF_6_TR23762/c0_g1_i1/m.33223
MNISHVVSQQMEALVDATMIGTLLDSTREIGTIVVEDFMKNEHNRCNRQYPRVIIVPYESSHSLFHLVRSITQQVYSAVGPLYLEDTVCSHSAMHGQKVIFPQQTTHENPAKDLEGRDQGLQEPNKDNTPSANPSSSIFLSARQHQMNLLSAAAQSLGLSTTYQSPADADPTTGKAKKGSSSNHTMDWNNYVRSSQCTDPLAVPIVPFSVEFSRNGGPVLGGEKDGSVLLHANRMNVLFLDNRNGAHVAETVLAAHRFYSKEPSSSSSTWVTLVVFRSSEANGLQPHYNECLHACEPILCPTIFFSPYNYLLRFLGNWITSSPFFLLLTDSAVRALMLILQFHGQREFSRSFESCLQLHMKFYWNELLTTPPPMAASVFKGIDGFPVLDPIVAGEIYFSLLQQQSLVQTSPLTLDNVMHNATVQNHSHAILAACASLLEDYNSGTLPRCCVMNSDEIEFHHRWRSTGQWCGQVGGDVAYGGVNWTEGILGESSALIRYFSSTTAGVGHPTSRSLEVILNDLVEGNVVPGTSIGKCRALLTYMIEVGVLDTPEPGVVDWSDVLRVVASRGDVMGSKEDGKRGKKPKTARPQAPNTSNKKRV